MFQKSKQKWEPNKTADECDIHLSPSDFLIPWLENQLRRTKPNCERLAEHQLTLSLE